MRLQLRYGQRRSSDCWMSIEAELPTRELRFDTLRFRLNYERYSIIEQHGELLIRAGCNWSRSYVYTGTTWRAGGASTLLRLRLGKIGLLPVTRKTRQASISALRASVEFSTTTPRHDERPTGNRAYYGFKNVTTSFHAPSIFSTT